MPENDSELHSVTPRRQFLKRGLQIAAGITGAAIVGGWTTKETETGKEGIQTSSGIFYPLEERHGFGRDLDDVPKPLDGYFKEMQPRFDKNVSDRLSLTKKGYFYDPSLAPEQRSDLAWSADLLEHLAKNGTPIVLGDVEVPGGDMLDMRDSFPFNTALEKMKTIAGLYVIGETIRGPASKVSRRGFLKSVAITTGAVAAAPSLSRLPLAGALVLDPEQKAAATRMLTRVHALANHLAPEDPILFFRNLMMANNLLLAAEDIKGQNKTLPKIAFNVGAAHAGIEDFLRLGHDFTRWLIGLYPNQHLESIIDLNGGLENFCSIRALTLPQNFNREDKNPPEIVDQKIIDEPLLNVLKQKLPGYVAKEEEKRRLEVETRSQDVAKIKELFNHYTNSTISQQINELLDPLIASEKYKQLIKVSKDKRSDKDDTIYSFDVSLPGLGANESPTQDIQATIVETADGRIIRDRLIFFLDRNGRLTRRQEQTTTIATSKEELRQMLNAAIPSSKESPGEVFLSFSTDEEGWEYRMSPDFKNPSDGLRASYQDGEIRGSFGFLRTGEVDVEANVWSIKGIDEGRSTR